MASLGTAHAAAGLANVASAAPTSGRTAIDGTRREPRPFKGTTFSYSQTPRPWFQARAGFHSKPTIWPNCLIAKLRGPRKTRTSNVRSDFLQTTGGAACRHRRLALTCEGPTNWQLVG